MASVRSVGYVVDRRPRPGQYHFPTPHDRIEWSRSSVVKMPEVPIAPPKKPKRWRQRWPHLLIALLSLASLAWFVARHFGWLP
jgi:hypothetical protein